MLARRTLGATDVFRLSSRHRIHRDTTYMTNSFSLWAPLFGPLEDWPLCVCDSSTVGGDLAETDVLFPDRVVENFQVHYSDKQQWYYVRDQMPSEFLIFRAVDTARPQLAAGLCQSICIIRTARTNQDQKCHIVLSNVRRPPHNPGCVKASRSGSLPLTDAGCNDCLIIANLNHFCLRMPS